MERVTIHMSSPSFCEKFMKFQAAWFWRLWSWKKLRHFKNKTRKIVNELTNCLILLTTPWINFFKTYFVHTICNHEFSRLENSDARLSSQSNAFITFFCSTFRLWTTIINFILKISHNILLKQSICIYFWRVFSKNA